MATADGPDFFRVRDVKKGDVVTLHADHSEKSKILVKIPYDAKKIKNIGKWPKYESDVPPTKENLADRDDLSEEEKSIVLKRQFWCKVEFQKIQGWVLCKYLGE